MKATESKTTSTQHQRSAGPFFGRDAAGTFFSETTEEETPRFFGDGLVQTKLTVGRPDDSFEREADAVAERIVDQDAPKLAPTIQRLCPQCERERKQDADGPRAPEETTVYKKPSFGAAGDAIEPLHRTDREPRLQRKCAACEQEEQRAAEEGETIRRKPAFESDMEIGEEPEAVSRVQMKHASGDGVATEELESRLSAQKGRGKPLSPKGRGEMESKFGADFGNVRVHTGSQAADLNRSLNAKAFTHGSDIFFGSGNYTPSSRGGKRLLAHELTHTIQQGAAATAPQAQTAAEETPTVQEDVPEGQLTDPDVVQRVSCPTSNPPGEAPPEDEEPPAEEESPKEIDAEEGADVEDRQEQAPDPEEFAPEPEENIAEGTAEETEKPDEKPVEEQAAEAAGAPPSDESEAAEEEQMAVLETAAEIGGGVDANPEGLGEDASPELGAEKEETAAAQELAVDLLDDTATQLSGVVSGGVRFADQSPEVAATLSQAARSAYLERKSTADGMAADFFSEAADKLASFIEQGRQAPDLLRTGTEEKKAVLAARIEQRRSATRATVAATRAQARAEAAAAIAQISAHHLVTVGRIRVRALQAKLQIQQDFARAREELDAKKAAQLQAIDKEYTDADREYRAVGPRVGQEAMRRGEEAAREFESKKTGEKDGFWDGYLTDNRWQARADAAREVGEQYRDGLIEEAEKQAEAAMEGKPRDIEAVGAATDQMLEQLTTAKNSALTSVDAQEERAVSNADETKQRLTATVKDSLAATESSLDEQEAAQLQFLADYGKRQEMAIERDAQKASAAIAQGVADAAVQLLQILADFRMQTEVMEAPDSTALVEFLARLSQSFDASLQQAAAQTAAGVEASQAGLDQGAEQALQALDTYSESGLENIRNLGTSFSTTVTSLTQQAIQGFEQQYAAFDERAEAETTTAAETFTALLEGAQEAFDTMADNLRERFRQAVEQLEEGLIGVLDSDMEGVICEEAEKAADQVEPWWKSALKIILVIVVIVVVALVIGPAVIGAVGAAAGALGASAGVASVIGAVVGGAIVGGLAGGVIQMGNNLIDGKDLLDGVGQAVIVGAIGGALGGAGGALAQGLANAGRLGVAGLMQGSMKFGTEAAFDVAGGILGDLAVGNPITLEGVLTGAAIGGAVSVGTANVGRMGRLGAAAEGVQTRSMDFGSRMGTRAGGRINSAIRGPDVEPPPPRAAEAPTRLEEPTARTEEPGARPEDAEVKTEGTESDVEAELPTVDRDHTLKVKEEGVDVCSRCNDLEELYHEQMDLADPENPGKTFRDTLDDLEAMKNGGEIDIFEYGRRVRNIQGRLHEINPKAELRPIPTHDEQGRPLTPEQRESESWRNFHRRRAIYDTHEDAARARLHQEYGAGNVADQVHLDVTVNGRKVRVVADNLIRMPDGSFRIVDAKYSSTHQIDSSNVKGSFTSNQREAFPAIVNASENVPVTVRGTGAAGLGVPSGTTIYVRPEIGVIPNAHITGFEPVVGNIGPEIKIDSW